MMSEDSPECTHLCDCAALHEIAVASANVKPLYLDQLKNGSFGVPAQVLKEFRDLYEEEAAELVPQIAVVISLNKTYRAAAARIADSTRRGFPRRPYDGDTDLYTAAIALVKNYTIMTTTQQAPEYDGMGCQVTDLDTWVNGLGPQKQRAG
jgi:hypothetical protein